MRWSQRESINECRYVFDGMIKIKKLRHDGGNEITASKEGRKEGIEERRDRLAGFGLRASNKCNGGGGRVGRRGG